MVPHHGCQDGDGGKSMTREAVEFGGSSSGVDSGHLSSSPSSHTPSAAPVPSSSICKWSPSALPALTLCGFKS